MSDPQEPRPEASEPGADAGFEAWRDGWYDVFLAILQIGAHGHGRAAVWGKSDTPDRAILGALQAWSRSLSSVSFRERYGVDTEGKDVTE